MSDGSEAEVSMFDELSQVQFQLQELAESFSVALNVEMEIFDQRQRIVGTGPVRDRIGEPLPSCELLARGLYEPRGRKLFFPGSMSESLCAGQTCPCPNQEICRRRGVYTTLEYRQSVFGVLGIFSENEVQAELLRRDVSPISGVIEQFARIITLFAWKQLARRKLRCSWRVVNAMLNTYNKGVVLLDPLKRVADVNGYLLDRLKVRKEEMVGRHISQLFPTLDLSPRDKKGLCQDLRHEVGNKQLYFMCTLKSLQGKGDDEWLLCYFEDCKDEVKLNKGIWDRRKFTGLSDIISRDEHFNLFKEKVKNVARNDSTVLLVGETGTGKELFARALHSESARRENPFVAINCGSIPENLLESELFGYEKGSFTGANPAGKPGRFLLADKGTLFLDELEVLPLYLQPKLLRAIEQREIERIGGGYPIPVDVRIVAATNMRLEDMVRRGDFREDLYYRLNVVNLSIPPLRERGDDVLVLAQYFTNEFSARFLKNISGLSKDAAKTIREYHWPGNVRELQNAIEYAINMETSDLISLESLPPQLRSGNEPPTTLRTDERRRIEEALARFGWTEEGKIQAAKYLGISRSTIYRKIRSYGMKPRGSDISS